MNIEQKENLEEKNQDIPLVIQTNIYIYIYIQDLRMQAPNRKPPKKKKKNIP